MPVLYALPFVYVLQFMPAGHGRHWQNESPPTVYSDIYNCAKRAMYLEHSQNWLYWGCKQVEIER